MPLLILAGAACAVAALLWLVYGAGHLGVDAMWSLQWGDDLLSARGLTPTNGTTPHPLSNLAAAVADLAGRDADRVLIASSYVGAAGLILATAALATRLSGRRAAGVGAALLIATRPELLASTVTGALDVWAAALMVGAVALATPGGGGAPARGRAAMLLLLAAGLLRPEAWALALGWWAWRAWTDRTLHASQLALALAAPLLWLGSDAVLTGDALYAIHQTDEAAGLLRLVQGIETGPSADLERAARGIGSAVQLPLLVALVGCGAWWLTRRATGARRAGATDSAPTGAAYSAVWAALVLFAVLLLAQAATGTLVFSRFAIVVAALAAALVVATAVDATAARWSPALVAGIVVAVVALPSAGAWRDARTAAGEATDRYEAARGALRPGLPCAPLATYRTGLSIYATRWTGLSFDEVLENQAGPLPGPASYADVARPDSAAFLRDPRDFPPIGAPGARVVRTTPGWVITTTCP